MRSRVAPESFSLPTRLLLVVFTLLAVTLASAGSVRAEPEEPEIWDPLEPVNRGVFWFNDQLDIYFLEPVAKAYDTVVPLSLQKGFDNFFYNLNYPSRLLGDLLQLKFSRAALHTGRFLINTTAGVGGMFDIAERVGLKRRASDAGLGLAYRGLPPGPYLVVPLIGPTTLRDGIGLIADTLVHPFAILSYSNVRAGITDPIAYGGLALRTVNDRADLQEAVEAAKEGSLDYYFFVQAAYTQHREAMLRGETAATDYLGSAGEEEFE